MNRTLSLLAFFILMLTGCQKASPAENELVSLNVEEAINNRPMIMNTDTGWKPDYIEITNNNTHKVTRYEPVE